MPARLSLALLAASSALVSACTPEASGQTVAVVNGEEISQAELNAELASSNLPASVDRKTVMPQLLQRMIDRRLMAQAAAEQGIDRSPEFLTRQRRMNEELLIGMASRRQADSVRVPDQRAIDAFIQSNPQMFAQRQVLELDQLQFDAPTRPDAIERLKAADTLDELSTTLGQLGAPATRTRAELDTATVPPEVLRQINGLRPGAPFIVPISGRMYASVITNRRPAARTPAEDRRLAAEAIRKQTFESGLDRQLKQLRSEAKIDYQSGFAPPPAAKAKAKS